ncbi:AAA family ATPase [Candidatus Micrarchaeota archaeon]|nr:AAA family ATPase [Candidatus Micrarchaeota archaeon]
MKIMITGTPGVGKSTIARALSKKLEIPLIDLSEVARENKLIEKNDQVDTRKLQKIVNEVTKNCSNYIIEGHLACEIEVKTDVAIVLRTEPKTLLKRLIRRKYPRWKVEENLLAEALDYCLINAEKRQKRVLQIETSSRSIKESLASIVFAIKAKRKKIDRIRYDVKQTLDLLRDYNERREKTN